MNRRKRNEELEIKMLRDKIFEILVVYFENFFSDYKLENNFGNN